MNIQKIIRKWVGVLIAAASYFVIHEGAHAIYALSVGAFKSIRILGIGIQVEVFMDKLSNFQLGLFCLAGAVSTLISGYIMLFCVDKIVKIDSKFIRAMCYYITIAFLFADPIYLLFLFNFVGGGDMNGIVYLMPQLLAQAIFAIILIINSIVFIKYILPKYKKAFAG